MSIVDSRLVRSTPSWCSWSCRLRSFRSHPRRCRRRRRHTRKEIRRVGPRVARAVPVGRSTRRASRVTNGTSTSASMIRIDALISITVGIILSVRTVRRCRVRVIAGPRAKRSLTLLRLARRRRVRSIESESGRSSHHDRPPHSLLPWQRPTRRNCRRSFPRSRCRLHRRLTSSPPPRPPSLPCRRR